MLSIKTPYGYFDLGQVSISLVLKSPIFTDNDGSYAYNFTLPATDTNRKIFGFPHRIEGKANTTEIAAELFFNGVSFLSGLMLVKDTNAQEYEISMGVGKGEFNYLNKDKSIKDLALATFTNGNNLSETLATYNASVLQSYPDCNFVLFPVENNQFFNDSLTALEQSYNINAFVQNYWYLDEFISDLDNNAGWPQGSIYLYNVFTPFFYHSFILKNIFDESGFILKSNAFTQNAELNKLVFFNTCAAATARYLNGDYYLVPDTLVYPTDHMPDCTIADHFKSLKAMFGAVVFTKNKTVEIKLIKDILLSNDIVEFSENISSAYTVTKNEYTGVKFAMTPDDADAYWTARVKDFADVTILDSVNVHALLPANGNEINDVRLCVVEDEYWIWIWDETTTSFTWVFYSNNFATEYQEDSGTASLESAISTVQMNAFDWNDTTFGAPTSGKWLVPELQQKGFIRQVFEMRQNKFSNRLLFYRGLQEMSSLIHTYPLGSSDVYRYDNYLNDRVKMDDANIALKWDGEYGLIENFWQEYIAFMKQTKIVKFTKALTPLELRSLDFSKKYRINDQNYLLKEVRVTITNDEIKVAEIDGYTC